MKTPFLLENLKSKYCQLVFFGSLILGYVLTPKNVLIGANKYIAFFFITTFALTIACVVRSVKEKVKTAYTHKSSTIGLLASVIGISTLQVCGLGTPVCGASVGIGIVTTVFPGFLINQVRSYSEIILGISILAQLVSLYMMNCFSFTKKNINYQLNRKEMNV